LEINPFESDQNELHRRSFMAQEGNIFELAEMESLLNKKWRHSEDCFGDIALNPKL
jgi:hypothetical protein